VREWTHLANLGTSGGTPEYGNETSGSIRGQKLNGLLSDSQFLKACATCTQFPCTLNTLRHWFPKCAPRIPEILHQFPGDPWIHYCNGYFEVYYSFNQRNPAVKGLAWYTDGSKMREGTGAGVFGQSVGRRLSFSLGKYATVFQAEIYAILACAHEVQS